MRPHHAEQEPAAEAAAKRLRTYSAAASLGGAAAQAIGKALPWFGIPLGPVLESLGEAVATTGETAAKGADLQEGKTPQSAPSLADLKKLLASDMAKLRRPFLVVIDDIDRLTTDEIREIFQLVKANADFPNLVFLLMFDRDIVAGALDPIAGGRGHEFLDKIVQVLFHVPQPTAKSVHAVFFEGLDKELAAVGALERWDRNRWGSVWEGGLSLYFSTLRNVYRFLASFGFHASRMHSGKVFELNPIDLIAIETLRLFEPAVFEGLPSRRLILTGSQLEGWMRDEDRVKAREGELAALLSAADVSRQSALRKILRALFPALFGSHADRREMARELRAGHEEFFERYFAMSLSPDEVSQADIRALVGNFGNPGEFVGICKSLEKRGLLGAAIKRLDAHRDVVPVEVFPELVTALVDAADLFPSEDEREFFSTEPVSRAFRLIHGGLEKIDDKELRYAHLRRGILEASGVALAVEILKMEDRALERTGLIDLIAPEHWEFLRPVVLGRIEEAVADGRLRKLRGLLGILLCWSRWAGEGPVREWIAGELKSGDDAFWLLRTFLFISRIDGARTTYNRYIRLDYLSSFADLEKLKALTASYSLNALPTEQMRALRAFRQALKWREEGWPADYRGQNEKHGNCLEEDS